MVSLLKTDLIGYRVRQLRKEANLTMEELADRLDVDISQGTISNIESGKHIPRADVIIAFAEYFNVTTDYILTGKKYLPPEQRQEKLELYMDEINAIAAKVSKLHNILKDADTPKNNRVKIDMLNSDQNGDDQQ